MRQFIVLQQVGDISRLRVVEYGTELKRPLVYWDITDDSKRLLLNTKVISAIKKYIAGGSFNTDYGALIGLPYDRLHDMLVSILGPDIERAKTFEKEQRLAHIAKNLGTAAGFTWMMSWFMLRVAIKIIIIPMKILLYTLLIFHIIK